MRSIVVIISILIVFGLVMLASASSDLGKRQFDDSFYYLKHQIIFGLFFGVLGFVGAFFFPYRNYKKIAITLLLISIVLLILVFTPLGVSAKGADRWLRLGPITFQPAEILKITFIIYLAAWLSGSKARQDDLKRGFIPFLIVIGVVSALLLKQPATSTVVILMTSALFVYFASGARMRFIFSIILIGIIGLSLIIYFTPYRRARVANFFNPGADVQGGNYQLTQSQIAIGSGGLFGVGYGQSTTKIHYLPEPVGDSIFAIIAEELGFIGAIVLIGLFVALILKILLLSKKVRNRFGKLLLIGFGSVIGFQAFVHMGSISGVVPLTGIPLPFISYGGTALAVFMTMGGMIANIAKSS